MSGFLADTHVLLWWLADDRRLTARAREGMADPAAQLFSAASVWEMAIKQAGGKLRVPEDLLTGEYAGAPTRWPLAPSTVTQRTSGGPDD